MAVKSGTFKKLADKMMNQTFNEFSKPMTIKTSLPAEFGQAQGYTNETGIGIELSISDTLNGSDLIQIGDKRIFTNASQWLLKPEPSNSEINFDGDIYTLITVNFDADNAAFFMVIRAK